MKGDHPSRTPTFSFRRAREWVGRIPDVRIRKNVEEKLAAIIEGQRGKR